MTKSNQKGAAFERQVAKELSLWISEGKRDDIFWRTCLSGGRSTQRAKCNIHTANSAGDICYLDKKGKWLIDKVLIECKTGYKNTTIIEMINNSKKDPVLSQWAQKAISECKECKRPYYWIIFKQYGKKPVIFFDIDFVEKIELFINYPSTSIEIYMKYYCMIGVNYETFFNWSDASKIKKMIT